MIKQIQSTILNRFLIEYTTKPDQFIAYVNVNRLFKNDDLKHLGRRLMTVRFFKLSP